MLLLQVGAVSFDRAGIADHAKNLASTVQGNLRRSLEALGVVSGGRSGGVWRWCCRRDVGAWAASGRGSGAPGVASSTVAWGRQSSAHHAEQRRGRRRGSPSALATPSRSKQRRGSDSVPPQDILYGNGKLVDNHTVKYGLPGRVDVGGQVTARDIIIATGSVPFVPPGAHSFVWAAAAC